MTLLELMTVLVIISILAVLLYPVVGWYQQRARRIACLENLKGLYTGTAAYLGANGGIWPQIRWNSTEPQVYARAWHDILQPFGLTWNNFICPSVQIKVGNPDYVQRKFNRMDYIPSMFDDKPWTAKKWERQPWFSERQNMHGNGQLLILANGSMLDLNEARKIGQQPQAP
jgi:prepilin-type N-terminal cleavage/methylation domain-containing protein